jgi:hypothetical protein
MIVSHGAGAERRVLLADANPAIGALPVATLDTLAEPAGALGAARSATVGPAWPAFRPATTELTVPSRRCRGTPPGGCQ